jgi:hypothetical protein
MARFVVGDVVIVPFAVLGDLRLCPALVLAVSLNTHSLFSTSLDRKRRHF